MCMSAIMPKPKVPDMPEPKLPRQAIKTGKAANFKGQDAAQIGFGQTGRSGGRALRIKKRSPQGDFGNIGNKGGSAGPVSIGAQVPR